MGKGEDTDVKVARLVPGDPLFGVPDRWEPSDYRKDKGQRAACGCIMSKDIGEYNTCPHLCHYCYANANNAAAVANWKQHLTSSHAETIMGKMKECVRPVVPPIIPDKCGKIDSVAGQSKCNYR